MVFIVRYMITIILIDYEINISTINIDNRKGALVRFSPPLYAIDED